MLKKYILIILALGFSLMLKSQDYDQRNIINIVVQKEAENDIDLLFLDSLNDEKINKFNLILTLSLVQSDSIFKNSINAIRVVKKWQKIIGKRHCFGDWTTGQVWDLNSILQVKRDNYINEYTTNSRLSEILTNWETSIYSSTYIEPIINKPIHVEYHSFFEMTQSYRDSLKNKYGENNIYSFANFTTKIKSNLNSDFIRLVSKGILIDSILRVEFQFINSLDNELIKKDVRKYIYRK